MKAGMATTSPDAVATSTSPILPANWEGFEMPFSPRVWNALIMPMTVPVRPIMGETTPMTER